ncbi:MAG TPA: hypothetical protein VFL61_14255 [Gaiellaceae bacterium]|nr:hypothetical protein [Gaiellaceae bacterium]
MDQARRARRRRAAGQHRLRRIAVLLVASAAVVATLLLTAFGSDTPARTVSSAPAPAKRLLPTGPPQPQVVAVHNSLQIRVPVAQQRITAVGYHAVDNGALALEPVGEQANKGLFARLVRRLAGRDEAGLAWYQLGGDGPANAVLNVGAAPGTDVYAPVDGVVVGISDYVISGKRLGARVDVQPSSQPSLVVSLTHLRPDPALTVGAAVTASSSKLGTVMDFSRFERQALARYTQDAGNHVSLEVHPAATLLVQ